MGEVLALPLGVLADVNLDVELLSCVGGVLLLSLAAVRSWGSGRGDLARISSWLESSLRALRRERSFSRKWIMCWFRAWS